MLTDSADWTVVDRAETDDEWNLHDRRFQGIKGQFICAASIMDSANQYGIQFITDTWRNEHYIGLCLSSHAHHLAGTQVPVGEVSRTYCPVWGVTNEWIVSSSSACRHAAGACRMSTTYPNPNIKLFSPLLPKTIRGSQLEVNFKDVRDFMWFWRPIEP